MGYSNSMKKEVLIDIESGGDGFPRNINSDPIAGNNQGKRLLNKLASGVSRYNILAPGGSISNLDSDVSKSRQDLQNNVKVLIDKNSGRQRDEQTPLLEKKHARGKPHSTNSKKASKPPRPPKGPSLDASDLKLVREISELVMKKRARKERVKALRRARAAKLSSSSSASANSTLCGMVVTVVFFILLIFQGFSWRNSSTSIFEGSPEPATGPSGLISVQVLKNILPNYGIAPSLESPSSVEQLFVSAGLASAG